MSDSLVPAVTEVPRRRKALWLNVGVLALVAIALLTGLFLVARTIEVERAHREQVRRTGEVLLALREVTSVTLNTETGQRGYLLTLDRRYLEPYRTGRGEIAPAIARVRERIGPRPTPRQAELLDEIENLAAVKVAEMDETVTLTANAQVIDARRRILSDEGQEAMERLRAAIGEMEEIESALLTRAANDTARAESRVLPLLALVIVVLFAAMLAGYLLVRRAARAEAEAAQATVLAEARDRADLLARELNHRVKNLFAVILAIVRMGGKEVPEARAATDRMAERIGALLTAHEVTQGTLEHRVASLGKLVETTLAPYRSERLTATLEGPEVMLPAKRASPLGLVLHELTTNAVKYGCWRESGDLSVSWTRSNGEVVLNWRERCAGAISPGEATGFGTRLMEASARQLRGTVERSFLDDGVEVVIRFPVED